MTKLDFRLIIKKTMNSQKIKVPELARQIGINQQTLYNYLAGRTEMTAGNLAGIFGALGIKFKN